MVGILGTIQNGVLGKCKALRGELRATRKLAPVQSADLKIPREAKILFLDWRSVASWARATRQNNLPISVLNAVYNTDCRCTGGGPRALIARQYVQKRGCFPQRRL
jgi:hypothetical protein